MSTSNATHRFRRDAKAGQAYHPRIGKHCLDTGFISPGEQSILTLKRFQTARER